MKLRIIGIKIEGAHSPYAWEQELGTTLWVDIELVYMKRIKTDDMTQAIGAEEATAAVFDISCAKNYQLLEVMAADIANALWDKYHDKLKEIVVKVRKDKLLSEPRIGMVEAEVRRG